MDDAGPPPYACPTVGYAAVPTRPLFRTSRAAPGPSAVGSQRARQPNPICAVCMRMRRVIGTCGMGRAACEVALDPPPILKQPRVACWIRCSERLTSPLTHRTSRTRLRALTSIYKMAYSGGWGLCGVVGGGPGELCGAKEGRGRAANRGRQPGARGAAGRRRRRGEWGRGRRGSGEDAWAAGAQQQGAARHGQCHPAARVHVRGDVGQRRGGAPLHTLCARPPTFSLFSSLP
jgi:hypothetical protein